MYWIDAYGGGLFLPFREGNLAGETYGGRYLCGTVKGSNVLWPSTPDGGHHIVRNFNDACNLSCAHDPQWACPLVPREI
jgi:uncharacterized protein (DUF1684 family)